MSKTLVSKAYFRASTIGIAVALLFGCGGSDNSSELTQRPSSVLVSETATILSVRTEMPSNDDSGGFEAQALNYTFAVQINSGPNAGLTMTGRLELKGEREDDGVTEVQGRLYPDILPTVPATLSDKELKKKFEADRKELKLALRVDLKLLSDELSLALKNGAVRGSRDPSAAQKEALTTFRAQFDLRMNEYNTAMTVLIAGYRAARRSGQSGGDDDDNNAAKGYEVHGTIGANGTIELKVKFGDKGKVVAIGTIAADGTAAGTLTGPGEGDKGTWTATATDVVTPPAADCAAQAATWSQGASTCNVAYAGGINGSSTALSDIVAPTTGTATASCTSGVLAVTSPLCTTAATPPPPPAACAAQAVTWAQGASSCNVAYSGGISGSSTALSDIVGPTTGTATASCTSGVLAVTSPLCTTAATPPPVGTFAAGKAKYDASCGSCHAAGATYDTSGIANLAGKGSLNVADLGTISRGMSGITLTAQEILDLRVFLDGVQ